MEIDTKIRFVGMINQTGKLVEGEMKNSINPIQGIDLLCH
jgi:hypothetical protein